MTSEAKIMEILEWVKDTTDVGNGFMLCLLQDLKHLTVIAQTEGIKEARDALNKVWNKE